MKNHYENTTKTSYTKINTGKILLVQHNETERKIGKKAPRNENKIVAVTYITQDNVIDTSAKSKSNSNGLAVHWQYQRKTTIKSCRRSTTNGREFVSINKIDTVQ